VRARRDAVGHRGGLSKGGLGATYLHRYEQALVSLRLENIIDAEVR